MEFENLSSNVLIDIFFHLSAVDISVLIDSFPEAKKSNLIHNEDFWQQIYIKKFDKPLVNPLLWYEAFMKYISDYTYCFGSNKKGQLGLGTEIEYVNEPSFQHLLSNIKTISTGDEHTLILTNDGRVYSFGDNTYGQIGRGSPSPSFLALPENSIPKLLPNLPPIKAISAGYNHSLLLTFDGKVYGFGNNQQYQLGLKNKRYTFRTDYTYYAIGEPKLIEGLENIKALSAGYEYSLVLTEKGKVLAFGMNMVGRMGDYSNFSNNDKLFIEINELSKIKDIVAAVSNSIFLTEEGKVYVLGEFTGGQETKNTPRLVTNLPEIKSISSGGNHLYRTNYIFLTGDGKIYAFGSNDNAKLGLENTGSGPFKTIDEPRLIPNLPLIQKVEAGGYFSLLLDYEGNVYIAGLANIKLSPGFEPSKIVSYFRKILGLKNIKDIVAGSNFAFFSHNRYTDFESIKKLISNQQIKFYEIKYSFPSEELTYFERFKSFILSEEGEVSVMNFTDLNGYTYTAKVRYDSLTNKISPV